MDKLEEHIRKNREDLDRYSPPERIWNGISTGIKKDKSPVRRWISVAAMIMVLLGTGLILHRYGFFRPGTAPGRNIDTSDNQANPQLKETEIYYNNLVNALYTEATPMLTANPEVKKEFLSDISHLDSICLEIKKDLKDNVANQEVVEALIQNYRIKIRLLEDMLTVLKENDNNPEKKKSHEL